MGMGMKVLEVLREDFRIVDRVHEDILSEHEEEQFAEIIERESGAKEMISLLTEYRRVYPAFESMPVGAPNSMARQEQLDRSSLQKQTDEVLKKYGAE